MSTSVVLADDHRVVREALAHFLAAKDIVVLGEASDGLEAVRLCKKLNPDVALLDLRMPLLNGLDAAREILHPPGRTAVIILTAHDDDRFVFQALKAGASGYVVKTKAADHLVRAIHDVAGGGMHFGVRNSRHAVERLSAGVARPPLTGRERQVLQLVAEGKTTKEIADILNISVKTADSHRTHVMKKLNIHDTAGIVRYAIREGIVSP
jgi:DNA-binding NarL/FixJ family response regulator